VNEADVYREWAPPPHWRDVVACCWEQRISTGRVQRVVPDGRADVLVIDSDRIEVVGLYDRVDLPLLPQGTWIRGIRLKPQAVAAAFRIDASSLRNRTLPVEDVLGAHLAHHLLDPRGRDAWIRSIQPPARVVCAVRLLRTRPVDATAEALGLSPRQLQRVLVADVGLAPKVFQRVLRMQRFLAAAERRASLADVATEAGYADQSHMTREVRSLAGLSPLRLLQERRVPLVIG
jgi:AraC-like DNA-binding protein